MRVAALQTTAVGDRDSNLAAAGTLVEEAADAGAELVVLPEYFSVAGTPEVLREQAELLDGPTLTWASATASRHGIHLVVGSIPERTGRLDGRLFNTSCLVGPGGDTLAAYRKIHLFDVALGGVEFRESDTMAPGDSAVVVPVGPWGVGGAPALVGLSLCYDIRFPELYRILALGGAAIITVPAAFTAVTGPAHWELLLRARAVEEQVFMIGAGQVGDLPAGMPRCHGHSMIVDPWGTVLAERIEPGPGVVLADLDPGQMDEVRARLPVLANRQPGAYVGLHGNDRGTTN